MYGWLFTAKGSGRNAIQHLQNAVRYAEEGQIIPVLGLARMMLGYGYCLLGELHPALKHIEKGLQIQLDAGFSILLAQYYYYLGMVHFDLGDFKNSLSYTDASLKLAIENKEKQSEGSSRILMGRVLCKANPSQSGKAEEFIQQGVKLLDKLKLKPLSSQGYLALGELYNDIGQRERAFENLNKAERIFQEMGMDYWLSRTESELERLQS
jgi:tetratricopeptide (TPR) repeat protein